MSLRVLMVMAGAPYGGAEAFFVTLSAALRRAGLDVHAVLRASKFRQAMLKEEGVPHQTLLFRRWLDSGTRNGLRRLAQQLRPDVVLTFAGRASSMMPKGEYALVGRLGGYYTLSAFKDCDHLICNTPDLRRYVLQGGWEEQRVSYIPNFPHRDETAAADRTAMGTPKEALLALAMGRLHPSKAFDVLIQAMARLPGMWLWIAGEGPEGEKLERLAHELGVGARVKFLGWRTDRGALLRAANVCVVPSRKEPLGNVIVEAWAHGVPVVAASSTGPSWLVRNREDALLVPVDDPVALSEAIREIGESPKLTEKLIAGGARRITEDFSEKAVVHQYVSLFKRLTLKARSLK